MDSTDCTATVMCGTRRGTTQCCGARIALRLEWYPALRTVILIGALSPLLFRSEAIAFLPQASAPSQQQRQHDPAPRHGSFDASCRIVPLCANDGRNEAVVAALPRRFLSMCLGRGVCVRCANTCSTGASRSHCASTAHDSRVNSSHAHGHDAVRCGPRPPPRLRAAVGASSGSVKSSPSDHTMAQRSTTQKPEARDAASQRAAAPSDAASNPAEEPAFRAQASSLESAAASAGSKRKGRAETSAATASSLQSHENKKQSAATDTSASASNPLLASVLESPSASADPSPNERDELSNRRRRARATFSHRPCSG